MPNNIKTKKPKICPMRIIKKIPIPYFNAGEINSSINLCLMGKNGTIIDAPKHKNRTNNTPFLLKFISIKDNANAAINIEKLNIIPNMSLVFNSIQKGYHI